MKTPREVLLARHQSVDAKLDTIREKIVGNLAAQRSADDLIRVTPPPSNAPGRLFALQFSQGMRQMMLSLRWHFAGLAAAWLLIALLHLGSPSEPPPVVAKRDAASLPQLVRTFQENRRQFLERLGEPAAEVSTPPQPAMPARRSERLSGARPLRA